MEKSTHEYVVPAPKGHLTLTGKLPFWPNPTKRNYMEELNPLTPKDDYSQHTVECYEVAE